MDQAHLEKEALRLPASERARLAEALLDSLDDEASQKVEAAWADLAEKRLEAFKRGEEFALEGPAVLAKLRSKLAQ